MQTEPKCTGENNHLYRDRMTESEEGVISKINETCSFCGLVKVIEDNGGDVKQSYLRTSYDPASDSEFIFERQECREGGSVHLWDPDWEYFCVPTEGPVMKVMDRKCERCDVIRREVIFRNHKGSAITYSRSRSPSPKGINA